MIRINRHRVWQLVADAGLIALAWWLAFELRFDHGIPPYYETLFRRAILVVIGIKLAVFVVSGFYDRWWRYVSTRDLSRIAYGVGLASVLAYVAVYLISPVPTVKLPRGIAALDLLLTLAFIAGSRLLARTLIERPTRIVARGKEVLVVGAGDAGQLVIRELQRNPQLGYTPIGLIDDDPRKKNLRVHGVRVLGTSLDLPHILRDNKPDEVLIAVPSASGEVRQRIVNYTREGNVPVKTLPGLYELISGESELATQIRPVQVEDVLGREPVDVDLEACAAYLRDQTVLITGAGGSIGSELCRQIAWLGPQRLILVDQGETPLFEIERELVDERGFTASVPVLADCRSRTKMRQVFERYQPGIVFHAAAYKHVPLMEANPLECVRNNVLATRTVADLAVEFDARRFVLVSSDKARNPAAVYGQSKAICEWIVEAYGARDDGETRFSAVRFGSVLGSAGSVVSIFRRQIAKGGPVTVTHPEMTRFFMTTQEAASLVIQAGAIPRPYWIGGRGEVFVLDMGEPVRIIDLATQMIRLSGKEPDRDIDIAIVGARPGEKLHEELWGEGETVVRTSHPAIMRVRGPIVDAAWLDEELEALEALVRDGETLEVVSRLSVMLRTPRLLGAEEPAHAEEEDTLHGERIS